MKYLFFDIEGACPKLSTIATFGYALTDESFNVLAREDILMNPASRYDWYVVKNLLSYTKAELAKQPKFDAHYDKLKSLLEDGETIVCGYSIVNDLKYLNSECKRYSLPPLRFSFLDVQTLADKYFESKNQIGIERAYAMLESMILLYCFWSRILYPVLFKNILQALCCLICRIYKCNIISHHLTHNLPDQRIMCTSKHQRINPNLLQLA